MNVLTIRGLRADVEILAIASTFAPTTIIGSVEVVLCGADSQPPILQGLFTAALGLWLWEGPSVEPKASSEVTVISPREPERYKLHPFSLTFRSSFEGSFKTRAEEGSDADHGTVLAVVLLGAPADSHILVTVCELPDPEDRSRPKPFGSAVSVLTNACGSPLGQATATAQAIWARCVPMIELPAEGIAAWEVVSSIATLKSVTFGMALATVSSSPVPSRLQLVAGFAPFYMSTLARSPSSTLPIPRFVPGTRIVDLELRSS